ncbi:MAG TPA: histidine kinase dimerization/phospho-acceptor domain-containing protein [Longimicrobium sp.]|nr:histidine kinase dimerization/phospho-acceptor domain-containing protein [Longimicrobium sp.]
MIETQAELQALSGADTSPAANGEALMLRANKLDLLERLSDGLAHEIKNPLHSMVINLEVLKRRVARADSAEEVQRYIGVLAGELERVNRRIELLLRLSRPGRGMESATLAELAEELMELIQLEARHNDLQVDYQPDGGMTRVQLRREPARRVILNLVFEVIDRVERGGSLCLRFATGDGEARLVVTGSGVKAADLEAGLHGSPRMAAAALLAAEVNGRVEVDASDGAAPALVFSLPAAR